MTITGEKLNQWIDSTSQLSERFTSNFQRNYGFPPDNNYVERATGEEGATNVEILKQAGAAEELLTLYSDLKEASLPDVKNGYFIHTPQFVVGQIKSKSKPTSLTGHTNDSITAFGTDGGGGIFAISHSSGVIYRLFAGSLIGSKYEADEGEYEIFTSSLWDFLKLVERTIVENT